MECDKLAVVHLSFFSVEQMNWEELFAGYNSLRAITFSSSIGFISKLIEKFSQAEIIFGNESVLSFKLEEILSFQNETIELLRENFSSEHVKLLDRIDDGSLKLFVANKKLSHEKIYLLESDSGSKRVIFGSANLSWQAFSGFQRENICYLDDEAGYQHYLTVFESLQEQSTNSISRKQLLEVNTTDNFDQIPFLKTIEKNEVLLVEPARECAEAVKFAMNVRMNSERLKRFMPETLKSGIIKISAAHIRKLKSKLVEEKKIQKEKESSFPQLVIDVREKNVTYMGEPVDLNPDMQDVKKDAELFIHYFEGFTRFYGDWKRLQKQYYEFTIWFFASPFMPILRWTARKFDNEVTPYPVYGILYGQSKAGKTSFLETLTKMMVGYKNKVSASDFTRSRIEGLKSYIKGVPIIVDDMLQDRYNKYAVEAIKNDDFGINENLLNYPAVAISANEDVKAVDKQVVRRAIVRHVEAALTNMEIMRSKHVSKIQKSIGTALYREYLRQMLERMPELLEQIKSDENNALPDVLLVSSQVLQDIFTACQTDSPLPEYIKQVSLRDYFDEKITNVNTINLIRKAWEINLKAFRQNRTLNELTYTVGDNNESNRILKQLPENLVAKKVGQSIVMKLDESQKFFGLTFTKRFLFF